MSIEVIDIGDRVYCDDCGDEYTSSPAVGGILFGSKAYCPKCAPGIEARAQQYGEEGFIRGCCPEGMKFADWCLQLRGGNNTIKVFTGDDAERLIDPKKFL